MERELLKKIVTNTEPKESFQIVVTDNKTKFTTRFNPHIQLKKNRRSEMALVNLETYYSFPNITDENSHFTCATNTEWYHIFVPERSYDIDNINKYIQQKMRRNGHADKITISSNTNTLKAELIMENGYQLDFGTAKLIGSVLGFNNKVYTNDYQESKNPVNITV